MVRARKPFHTFRTHTLLQKTRHAIANHPVHNTRFSLHGSLMYFTATDNFIYILSLPTYTLNTSGCRHCFNFIKI